MEVQALSPETIQDTTPASTATPTPILLTSIDSHFAKTTNLTSATLGASTLSFSDEWFAAASNLLTPTPPIRRKGVFVHTGAWYDGWETRRHNSAEFDWVVIKLGVAAGRVEGVEVDTAFFDGNHAELAGVEGTFDSGEGADERVKEPGYTGWGWILKPQPCGPSQRQAWDVGTDIRERSYTHVRLRMYPDGGIARLRLYGHAVPKPWDQTLVGKPDEQVLELSAATNGGLAVACSDEHFGVVANLLLPGRGKDMGDGWETARHRGKGHTDWVVVRLGMPGTAEKIVVDTKDFRGNFPRSCAVEGWLWGQGGDPEASSEGWVSLVGESKCQSDSEHAFENVGGEGKIFSHVKLVIVPDGGVKRFRVWGRRRG